MKLITYDNFKKGYHYFGYSPNTDVHFTHYAIYRFDGDNIFSTVDGLVVYRGGTIERLSSENINKCDIIAKCITHQQGFIAELTEDEICRHILMELI